MPSSPRPRRPQRGATSGGPRRSGGGHSRRSSGGGRSQRPVGRPSPARSPFDVALDEAAASPAPPVQTFAQLGLPAPLVNALARDGVHEPFAIQSRTLPDALAGHDVLGRAQTGSGKTLGFGLPMLSRLAGGTRTVRRPRGLVLLPTRELAQQVTDVLTPLGIGLGLNVLAVYGGAPLGRQIDRLGRGVDILVATPGRLVDLLERRACSLADVEITVLDEADYMADLGFLPVVRRLLGETPAGGQRLLFSATLDRGVEKLVTEFLTDPKFHAVAQVSTQQAVEADHHMFVLRHDAKVAVAGEIAGRPARTLFFVRTKHGADRLARQLSRTGVEASAIHGNLNQNQRQRALNGFAAGHPRVLVATDVAARGIHVDDVDLVVHFDPPADHKDYLHRSGRTARAGAGGTVVALVDQAQVNALNALHREAGIDAQRTTDVHAEHDAVRSLAASGQAVPPPPPPRAERPAAAAGNGARRRPPQHSAGRRGGARGRDASGRAMASGSSTTSGARSPSDGPRSHSAGGRGYAGGRGSGGGSARTSTGNRGGSSTGRREGRPAR